MVRWPYGPISQGYEGDILGIKVFQKHLGWQQISEVGAGGQQMFWPIFETKNDKFENIFSAFIKGTPDRCMGTD